MLRIFSSQHPTSDIRHPDSHIPHPTSEVKFEIVISKLETSTNFKIRNSKRPISQGPQGLVLIEVDTFCYAACLRLGVIMPRLICSRMLL